MTPAVPHMLIFLQNQRFDVQGQFCFACLSIPFSRRSLIKTLRGKTPPVQLFLNCPDEDIHGKTLFDQHFKRSLASPGPEEV